MKRCKESMLHENSRNKGATRDTAGLGKNFKAHTHTYTEAHTWVVSHIHVFYDMIIWYVSNARLYLYSDINLNLRGCLSKENMHGNKYELEKSSRPVCVVRRTLWSKALNQQLDWTNQKRAQELHMRSLGLSPKTPLCLKCRTSWKCGSSNKDYWGVPSENSSANIYYYSKINEVKQMMCSHLQYLVLSAYKICHLRCKIFISAQSCWGRVAFNFN